MSAGIGGLGALKLLGIVLVAGGVLALVYGGFSYTKSTQQAKIGPLELSIKDTETVNVPIWVGAGALAIGGFLLLVRR